MIIDTTLTAESRIKGRKDIVNLGWVGPRNLIINELFSEWFVPDGDGWKRLDSPEITYYYNAELGCGFGETFNACNSLTTIIVSDGDDSSENWPDIEYVI